MCNTDLKNSDNFKEFISGKTILVKNSIYDYWQEEIFLRYESCTMYPYICVSDMQVGWKYAKII
jgi:hypothetical protein